jgi:hypothetical protein
MPNIAGAHQIAAHGLGAAIGPAAAVSPAVAAGAGAEQNDFNAGRVARKNCEIDAARGTRCAQGPRRSRLNDLHQGQVFVDI